MATAVDSLQPRESTAQHRSLWPRPFEYWHLLSLDAPTVAALWAWFFARAMRVHLPWHAPLILALGTWLIYVADRLLDGYHPSPESPLRRRHHFHARYRVAFLTAALLAGALLVWLIVARMSANARIEDTALFLVAILYFVIVHQPGSGASSWLPKELAVGIVFAAATAVPAWSRLDASRRLALLPAVALFAMLCWLNCVAIERWENRSSDSLLRPPGAHRTTRWAANHFRKAGAALAVVAGAFAAFSVVSDPDRGLFWLAALASALCLILVDRYASRTSVLHLRISADAALLTPILFWFVLR